MTANDYASIQRNIGYIEGLVSSCDTVVCDGIIGALQVIEGVIDADNQRITDTDTVHLKFDKEWAEDFLRMFDEIKKNCIEILDDDGCDMIFELKTVIKSKLEDLK